FGNQNVGATSTAQIVTLTNSGTAVLSISSIVLSGTNASDFAQTNTCPSTLAPSATCTISVTFTPPTTGARRPSLTFTDNAATRPQQVGLSGTGVVPPTVSPLPVISRNAPAYTNSFNAYDPSRADDGNYATLWRTNDVPTASSPIWLAYDLSGVPTAH